MGAADPGDTPLWGGPLRHVYRKQWPGLVHRLDAGTSGVMVVALQVFFLFHFKLLL